MDAVIPPTGNAGLATGKSYLYGIERFRDAYTPRQRAVLLELVKQIHIAHRQMLDDGIEARRAEAITVYLSLWMSRLSDRFNALARWNNARETIESLTSMKRIAMTWDYPEVNIFAGSSGSWQSALNYMTAFIEREANAGQPATVLRGSATKLSAADLEESSFDAVITDPPYYDNESYSELSDTFYVWLQPALQHVFPEHFASQLTPKRQECVAAAYRQGGTAEAACRHFEASLAAALGEARRVLKPDGILTLVYAPPDDGRLGDPGQTPFATPDSRSRRRGLSRRKPSPAPLIKATRPCVRQSSSLHALDSQNGPAAMKTT